MLDFNKILDGLPKLETLKVSNMTLDDVINLIIALEDAQNSLDTAMVELNKDNTDSGTEEEVQEEMAADIEEDSDYNPDGSKKTRLQKADERWEKRQKWEREMEEKLLKSSKKVEGFLNYCTEQISMYASIAVSLINVSNYISKLMEILEQLKIKFLNSQFVKELEAVINIVMLTIKKIGIYIKMKMSSIEYSLWAAVYGGKTTNAIAMAQAWLVPIIQAIQVGLSVITKVLDMLPSLIAVDGEGMSFFLTPKSLKATKMNIINFKQSVMDFLNQAIATAIQSIQLVQDQAAFAAKGASIASGVLASQAAGSVVLGDIKLPDITPYEVLYRGVDAIINLIPIPKPMPKIEQLNMITNPGWLLFLITGWVPAGKQSFGMMGMP